MIEGEARNAPGAGSKPFWTPRPEQVSDCGLARFATWARSRTAHVVDPLDYDSIWRWSTSAPEEFWLAVSEYFDVKFGQPPESVLSWSAVDHATWFAGATLNYAREALSGGDDHTVALKAYDETGWVEDVSYGELRRRVSAVAAVLADAGVTAGDVVAGYLPNRAEAVVAFLATASLGAVWTQCAPDYSAAAALDRFGQVHPRVLIAATHYVHGGRRFDRTEEVRALIAGLGSLGLVVLAGVEAAPELRVGASGPVDVVVWSRAVKSVGAVELTFADVPFDHPLWILFTSGTTGKPKGIVHGHGGIVLEHRKLIALHLDVRPAEPLFWYSSTNWVMWNIQVGALLAGATVVLYEGSPTYPGTGRLWEIAAEAECVTFGTSPGYLAACERDGVRPQGLRHLRMLGSTGSVLSPSLFGWFGAVLGGKVLVNSISGGTDVASAFVGAAPLTSVWPGELSRPCLGVAVEARTLTGDAVIDRQAELVVTLPLPSMPLRFWGDPGNVRLHETYFDLFPGLWRQGDSITYTGHGSVVIHGRSDATLNRNGVRFGSAEVYDVVERHPLVADALVVGVDGESGRYWMPLFVVCRDGQENQEGLTRELRSMLRSEASPRHVPDDVIFLSRLPRTRTGKRLEVPLKRALQGDRGDAVISVGAIDDAAAWGDLVGAGLARRPW